MKKLIIIILLILMNIILSAQTTKIGITTGVDLANVWGEDTTNQSVFKLGFVGGLFCDIPFENEWAFKADILYKSKGWQSKDHSDWKRNLNYLEIPLMLKFMPEDLEPIYLFSGPQFSYLLSAKAVVGDNSTDVKEFHKTTEFGAVAGIGYDAGFLSVEARYDISFTSNVESDYDVKRYNNSISLLFGISFFNSDF